MIELCAINIIEREAFNDKLRANSDHGFQVGLCLDVTK